MQVAPTLPELRPLPPPTLPAGQGDCAMKKAQEASEGASAVPKDMVGKEATCPVSGEKFKIAAARRYTGLSGYKRLLESKLDAVVIETPPYFHPQQAADAVDAGKHVYLAKPIAVDVPGCIII